MASPDRPSPSLESCLDPEYAKKYREFPEVHSRDGQPLGHDLAYSGAPFDARISLLCISVGVVAQNFYTRIGLLPENMHMLGIFLGLFGDQVQRKSLTRLFLSRRTLNP